MIKREYHQDKLVRDGSEKITEVLPGAVKGIRAKWADSGRQNFSPNWVHGGVQEGWLSMGNGKIVMHTLDDGPDLLYSVIRTPGYYCCHCEQSLPDAGTIVEPGVTLGLKHVRDIHGSASSPDPCNPSGYRKEDHYSCLLDTEDVQNVTPEERARMEMQMRHDLSDKIRAKYGQGHGERPRKIVPFALQSKISALPPVKQADTRTKTTWWQKLRNRFLIAIPMLWILLRPFTTYADDFYVLCMADLVFNIAKGRSVELYIRVDTNDPANSALIVAAWNTTATDATIRDLDTVAAIEADVNTAEATNTGYARKVLTDADLAAAAPDDTNDRFDIDIPDQTWTAVATAPGAWTDLSINYDNDTTVGTDSAIVPMTWHDFAVTPDGSDITAQIAAAGFFRAS